MAGIRILFLSLHTENHRGPTGETIGGTPFEGHVRIGSADKRRFRPHMFKIYLRLLTFVRPIGKYAVPYFIY